VGLLLALASAALLAGCRPEESRGPTNLLLVSIDTLRADHLGTYGYARPTSPNLDAFARRAVTFDEAISPSSWTLPAHASLLTGTSPYRHGAVRTASRISPTVPTLAERLRERGYHTVGFVNAPFVSSGFGFARGFDAFGEIFERRLSDPAEYQRRVLATLPELRPPFFLFVHYMDVHLPYRPPVRFNVFAAEPERGLVVDRLKKVQRALERGTKTVSREERQRLIDFYDGEILAMDDKLGELLRSVERLFPNTVVVVTSDHGEEFLEHGNLFHARTLYDEVLRVPLIVAGPGIARGARVTEPVSLVDVVPSVLDWLAVPHDGRFDGRSLAAALRGEALAALADERLLHLHTAGPAGRLSLRGVRTSTHKLIRDDVRDAAELYDLGTDPRERRNVAAEHAAHPLHGEIARLELPAPAAAPPPDARTVESLRALGYL